MEGEGLRGRGLRRVHGGRAVLAGLDLLVRPGEVLGLLGPNGAGKTTCFRILAGLDEADAGAVTLDGLPLDGLPLWRRVRAGLGYLAQEPSVFRDLSVEDNLRVPLEARGAGVGEAEGLLDQLGLLPLRRARAGTLSGGERRRLEIARSLAARPRVLLLDEPFAGVDPVAVAVLQRHIRGLAAAGIGVLLTDHAVHEALHICDAAILLDAGQAMVRGSPEAVAADPFARARYLGPDFRLRRSDR